MSTFFVILLLNLPRQRWRRITNRLRQRAKVTWVDFRFRSSPEKNYENHIKLSVGGREELKHREECKCVDWTQKVRDRMQWKVIIIMAMNLLTWYKNWWFPNKNPYLSVRSDSPMRTNALPFFFFSNSWIINVGISLDSNYEELNRRNVTTYTELTHIHLPSGMRTRATNTAHVFAHAAYVTGFRNDSTLLNSFTFTLPCIVIDFFLNNQPDAVVMLALCRYFNAI
jgi:hypothetical protein